MTSMRHLIKPNRQQMTLTSIGRAIQTGVRISKRLGKYDPGLRTIDKFAPPHLRKPLRGLYKAGQAGILGKDLVSIAYDYMQAPDTPGNAIPFSEFPQTRTVSKTRYRRSIGSRRRCIGGKNYGTRKRYSRPRRRN